MSTDRKKRPVPKHRQSTSLAALASHEFVTDDDMLTVALNLCWQLLAMVDGRCRQDVVVAVVVWWLERDLFFFWIFFFAIL